MSKTKSHGKDVATTDAKEQPKTSPTASMIDLARFRWPDLFRFPESILTEHSIRVEEYDEGATHVVRAEMPGIDPDRDVDLSVDHGLLRVRAERRHQETSEEKGRYHSEFSYGAFSRTVSLPPGADEDDVTATYSDGILEIRFPTDGDRANARKIPVNRG